MVLFWSARLLFLRKNSPLHIYFILHVYCWYLYVQNFTHDTYGITDKKGPYYKFELFSFKNSTLLLHLHLSILGFYQVLCTFNDFPDKKSTLHGLILVCTFIDFEKKFPPARLLCPTRLMFFKNFSSCTFIPSCTSIRYTRVQYIYVQQNYQ